MESVYILRWGGGGGAQRERDNDGGWAWAWIVVFQFLFYTREIGKSQILNNCKGEK